MKVRLLKKKTIEEYTRKNTASKSALILWLNKLHYADWETPNDILYTYPSADLLGKGSNRVIFNIGGNKYRLICKYWFTGKFVYLYIKWIGTHAGYDELCTKNKQYTVEDY